MPPSNRSAACPVSQAVDQLAAAAEVVRPEVPSESRDGVNASNASPEARTGGGRPRNRAYTASRVPPGGEDDETPIAAPSWPAPPDDRAYHGLVGDYVRAVGAQTEADPVALLMQFLIMFGNLIGRTAHFVAEASDHHANLYAVLVGVTAKGRKGSSWEQIRSLADDVDSTWARHRIQSGLSSGEGLIWAVRDPIEKDELIRDRT